MGVSSLLSDNKENFVEDLLEEYDEMRDDHYATLEDRRYLTFEQAQDQNMSIDFDMFPPAPVPHKIGVTVIDDVSLANVVHYIDWNPFFQVWELRGRYPNRGYPKIFLDEKVGTEAKRLFNDAQSMIKLIISEKKMSLKGVVGLFPANRSSNGEDIHIYQDEDSRISDHPCDTFCMLRQQGLKENGGPYLSQADFIAPRGYNDYLGMFAVSCHGCDVLVEKFASDNDDFSKIMVQALADRFVEAFAEFLHRHIRIELWGYARDEKWNTEDLLKTKYDGIRPAPGYPSQPDHTEKLKIWEAIKPKELVGIDLSDSLSMIPASSVSALVFAHPQSQYFAVGKIGKDQINSYTERKKSELGNIERWLSPALNYN